MDAAGGVVAGQGLVGFGGNVECRQFADGALQRVVGIDEILDRLAGHAGVALQLQGDDFVGARRTVLAGNRGQVQRDAVDGGRDIVATALDGDAVDFDFRIRRRGLLRQLRAGARVVAQDILQLLVASHRDGLDRRLLARVLGAEHQVAAVFIGDDRSAHAGLVVAVDGLGDAVQRGVAVQLDGALVAVGQFDLERAVGPVGGRAIADVTGLQGLRGSQAYHLDGVFAHRGAVIADGGGQSIAHHVGLDGVQRRGFAQGCRRFLQGFHRALDLAIGAHPGFVAGLTVGVQAQLLVLSSLKLREDVLERESGGRTEISNRSHVKSFLAMRFCQKYGAGDWPGKGIRHA
ncbi:hypothetical protein FQZ97_774220 [compost metagenome]